MFKYKMSHLLKQTDLSAVREVMEEERSHLPLWACANRVVRRAGNLKVLMGFMKDVPRAYRGEVLRLILLAARLAACEVGRL